MMIVTLILALAIAVVAVIFALQNSMLVTVSFFGYAIDGSLALFLLLTLVVGIVIGLLVMSPGAVKRSLELRGHRKRIGGLEKEVEEHKAKVAELQKPKPVTPLSPPSEIPKPVTPSSPPSETPKPQ